MVDWGSLIAGFGFRFRSLINLLISGYLLATALVFFGIGKAGFTNLASAAGFVRLPELGNWIDDTYRSLGAGNPSDALKVILGIWLALVCLVLRDQYKEGFTSNLMPNSCLAVASVWALWVDLLAPGMIWNLALTAILLTLAWTAWSVDHFRRGGFETILFASFGIATSFVYVVVAPPLWLAVSDRHSR